MSVCLYCLFASISLNFLRTLPVAVAQFSSGSVAIRYVLPVLRVTSCLLIIGQAQATQVRHKFKVIHQEAAQIRYGSNSVGSISCGVTEDFLWIFVQLVVQQIHN